MTVVKDDEVAGAEEVATVNEAVEADDKNDLELMTDSKLPDDWSIIGSKGLDNEGSDGESVEVIPCEEEKSEDSASAYGSSPNKLAIETREKIMQTEETAFFHNFTIWHPGIIAFSIICHLLICLVFYSANDQGESPDLRNEFPQINVQPALAELIEDWEHMSPRHSKDKAQIINVLTNYFPVETFKEEIVALLEKDMMLDPTMSAFHKKRPYTPNPPPPAQHKTTKLPVPPRIPPNAKVNMEDPPRKFSEPPEKKFEDVRSDCSNCKKYSSDCKKFCKHNKGKNLKYYYDKIIAPIVKKFPNFKHKF